MNSPRSSGTNTLLNAPSALPPYRPEDFRAFLTNLSKWADTDQLQELGTVAGRSHGHVQPWIAPMVFLMKRTWSVKGSFERPPANGKQLRTYNEKLAKAEEDMAWFAPDGTIVSELDAMVLAARSDGALATDALARRNFLEAVRPRIMGLAESAAEGLLATFDPTRDSYLRVQVIFRTLCEWRYDYAGDQTRPSESPESIVIRSFLRTLAERLSRAYLQPPDPSVQHRVREELRATTELSKATASMLASTDPYATRHPLANMCLDIGKYSAAALLQIWSLSSSARIFLWDNARETLSPIDLSAEQWTELGDAYAEILRDGRSRDFSEGFLSAAYGRKSAPGFNVFCAPPEEGETGTYMASLQIWERGAKHPDKRGGDEISPEDIMRQFPSERFIRVEVDRTAFLHVGNDAEISCQWLGSESLGRILGPRAYARLRAFALYWMVQCSVVETQVLSPVDALRELPDTATRRERDARGRSRRRLMSFPHPLKTLVVREPPKPAETRECGTDPERFTNSHARILRRGARPSYLAFVRSRLRDVRLRLRVVDTAGRTLREETFNVDNGMTDHETAYRRFVAVADSLEAERENGGYYVYYETLSGSISPTEAANLAKIGFEIDPGRVRDPRKSPVVAHMEAMKAGEVDVILSRDR